MTRDPKKHRMSYCMGDKPDKDELLDAIQSSGYLMEQEVATVLESLGFLVQPNWAFEDIDQGKSREIDAHAFRQVLYKPGSLSVSVILLCECKNNTAPFVFIGRNKGVIDRFYEPMEYSFPKQSHTVTTQEAGLTTERRVPAFRHLGFDKHHYYFQQETKAVQFCKIVRRGKSWVAQHGGLYDSVFYPLAKALVSLRNEYSQYAATVGLFFPMVVLNGDMYYIDSMAKDAELVETSHVTFVRELRAEKTKGHFMVDFVRTNTIGDFFLSKVTPFIEHVAEVARDTPDLLR